MRGNYAQSQNAWFNRRQEKARKARAHAKLIAATRQPGTRTGEQQRQVTSELKYVSLGATSDGGEVFIGISPRLVAVRLGLTRSIVEEFARRA